MFTEIAYQRRHWGGVTMTDTVSFKLLLAVVPGLLGFLGSWIGARIALSGFRRQRAFDKRLDWYERAAKSLRHLAQRIEVAMTFQREEDVDPEFLKKLWRQIQSAHLDLDEVVYEAGFYGSAAAIALMNKIGHAVQGVADSSEAFDPDAIGEDVRDAALEKVEGLIARLRKAHAPLVAEGRRHLGLDEVSWMGRLARA